MSTPSDSPWQSWRYVFNNLPSINRCGDIECLDGFFKNRYQFLSLMGAVGNLEPGCRSGPLQGLLAYGLESPSNCRYKLQQVCQRAKSCPPSFTFKRNINGDFILSTHPSDDGDKECIPCPKCPPGTYVSVPCTMTSYPVCVKCPWENAGSFYELNGACVSNIPKGYYPYQYVVSTLYRSLLTEFDTYPLQVLKLDNTLENLPAGTNVLLNTLIPCSSPPTGYEFKDWDILPTVKQVSIITGTEFVAEENCNIGQSSRCKPYNRTSKTGWFMNASNVCQPCTRSSENYQTCGWFQFGDLETCNGIQDTQCSPCRGNRGPESVHTNTYSPFFFDDSVEFPCNYDCNTGFYRETNGICTLCSNKPEFSNYAPGPLRISDSDVDGKFFISPTDFKYFGGTKDKGCNWECLANYRKIEIYASSPRQWMCEACPSLACLPGTEPRLTLSGCSACLSCPLNIRNAYYVSGCNQVCNAGFYKKNATHCEPCMLKTCSANQFNDGCIGSNDYFCVACLDCALGSTMKKQCNATHNTQCSDCTNTLIPNSQFNTICQVVCLPGYVMSNGECVSCASNDNDCAAGKYYSPECTAETRGCLNCTLPQTYYYCWIAGIYACGWSCIRGYRKVNGVQCQVDNSVLTSPQCLTPVVYPPPTISTTAPLTTRLSTTATNQQTTSRFLTSSTVKITTTTTRPTVTTSSTRPASTATSAYKTTTSIPTTSPIPEAYRYTIDVENLNVQQCLCKSREFVMEMSLSFQSPIYIISCSDQKRETMCVNFTCPCGNQTTRRLLQLTANSTRVSVVSEKIIVPNDTAVNNILKKTFSVESYVKSSSTQKLDMQGVYWNVNELFKKFVNGVLTGSEDMTLYIIIGTVGGVVLILIVVALVLIFYVFKKEIFGSSEVATPLKVSKRMALYVKLNQKAF